MESKIMGNKYSRKSKENEKVDLYFASLINRFHQFMFEVDHDDPRTPNADIFQMSNLAWITFAERWNKQAKKVFVDKDAFYNYAIKRDI
jgi:hypothetical protein